MGDRPKALVTGGSRGIGAEVAAALGRHGYDVVLSYRAKHRRAALVKGEVERWGGRCWLVAGDLADAEDLQRATREIMGLGPYSAIVLAASGGLEPGKAFSYAMAINCYAAVALTAALLPCCLPRAKVIFVTSHGAHFYHRQPVLPMYEPVALSKQAGEQCLRRMSKLFDWHEVGLEVVSGDIIEGTTTATRIERACPGFVRRRRQQVGDLPSIGEFAEAIVRRARSDFAGGAALTAVMCGSIAPYLVGAGGTEWLAKAVLSAELHASV